MKYLKLFFERGKMSLMAASIYRINFILMVAQSVVNSLMSILCVDFIYGSITQIAEWNKQEMISLMCTALIVNQLFRAFVQPNQHMFLRAVGTGDFDRMILKPINIGFQINLGRIDISSLLSLIAPVVILLIQLRHLQISIHFPQILGFIFFVFNGVLILSFVMYLLYASVFMFIKVDGLDNIYYTMMDIAEKPREIFPWKALAIFFLSIIPAIPLANVPIELLLGKITLGEAVPYIGVAIAFGVISESLVRVGIKKYTSASS